ncbi:YitT family protein [Mesomycoplasma ovipneumoniae]|uniref:YitT family protein n=1 Tax=Mesomycoplasma ovipneumoniae TaxID=29562 RepID=UPI002965712B|nr:YitT family protein [Mesomycoplasma ovipneumoniae]MDW2861462.1 YitT family protein [Mesomycoplasma ovipneumoniae]
MSSRQSNKSSNVHCSCSNQKNHNLAKCLKNQLVLRAEREIFYHNQSKINLKNFWKKRTLSIIMMAISALFFTLGVIFFLGVARTVPTGVSAIPALTIIIINSQYEVSIGWSFAIIYFVINIPLIIFILVKVPNKSFSYLTFIWLFFQIVWNQVFSLDTPIRTFLINNILIPNQEGSWTIFYYTIIGSILSGWAIGMAWKFGGSCGGTDYITYYIALKYRKPIGKIMFSISIFFGLFSIIILYFLEPSQVDGQLFGQKLASVFLYLIVSSSIVSRIYPKYGKILLQIYTNHPEKIVEHLKSIKYWHSYNIWEGVSGYTGQKQWRVETIIYIIEKNAILEEIAKTNVGFWYSATKILQTTDRFDATKIN